MLWWSRPKMQKTSFRSTSNKDQTWFRLDSLKRKILLIQRLTKSKSKQSNRLAVPVASLKIQLKWRKSKNRSQRFRSNKEATPTCLLSSTYTCSQIDQSVRSCSITSRTSSSSWSSLKSTRKNKSKLTCSPSSNRRKLKSCKLDNKYSLVKNQKQLWKQLRQM